MYYQTYFVDVELSYRQPPPIHRQFARCDEAVPLLKAEQPQHVEDCCASYPAERCSFPGCER